MKQREGGNTLKASVLQASALSLPTTWKVFFHWWHHLQDPADDIIFKTHLVTSPSRPSWNNSSSLMLPFGLRCWFLLPLCPIHACTIAQNALVLHWLLFNLFKSFSKQQAPGRAYFSWTQCCHLIAIQDMCVQDWFKLNWIETVLEKD